MDFLAEWLRSIGVVLAQSGPYLLVGFAIAGVLKVLLPERLVVRHLGRDDLRSVGIAALFGAPLPLCSCSVLPTAAALRRAGASKGATTSFMISTPETGVDSIGVTWALMDPLMTIARPLAAVCSAVLSGSLVNVLVRRKWDGDSSAAAGASAASADTCCAEPAHVHAHDPTHDHDHARASAHDPAPDSTTRRTPPRVLADGLRYGFGPLMADLTPSFVLGFALSGLILVLVPADFFGSALPSGLPAMLLMLVVGMPLYICASASTPVAAALVARGLDPGAALVLLLAGPATSMATMVVVKDLLGKRVLAVYIASIACVALVFGALVNLAYGETGLAAGTAAVEATTLGPVSILSAIALIGLLAWHATALKLGRRTAGQLRALCAPLGFDPTTRLARALALGALLLGWASTGLSVVDAGQVGFRLRFGEVVGVHSGPGRVLHAPFPFERVESVPTALVRGLEVGFDPRRDGAPTVAEAFARDLAGEAEVIAGDENLLRVNWSVQWRVSDAQRFRFGLDEPTELLRAFAESSLRRVFARRPSDALLIAEREELQAAVRTLLQTELDEIHAGVEVVIVNVIDLHAPEQVHEAYRDVASAVEDEQRQIRRAERYEKELTAQARARAFALEEGAKATGRSAVERAHGEAHSFLALLEAQRADPALFRYRLQREAAERALSAARLVLVVATGIDVRPMLRGAGESGATPAGAATAPPSPWQDEDRDE